MQIVAAVNGMIPSEVAALYAGRFAAVHGLVLTLLHVENPGDRRLDVERSMAVIEGAAARAGVPAQRVFLGGDPATAIRGYLAGHRVDTLFCGTSRRRHLWRLSLREELTRLALPADLAVVQVVRLDAAQEVRNLVLSIEEDRLPVPQFTFVAALARAYNAAIEVYSVTPVADKRPVGIDSQQTRERLKKINDHLRHYLKLAQFLGLPLHIKHAAARPQIDQLLYHLAHRDCQLLVIGGRRLSRLGRLLLGQSSERLRRETPVNTIVFYERQH